MSGVYPIWAKAHAQAASSRGFRAGMRRKSAPSTCEERQGRGSQSGQGRAGQGRHTPMFLTACPSACPMFLSHHAVQPSTPPTPHPPNHPPTWMRLRGLGLKPIFPSAHTAVERCDPCS